MKRFTTDQNIDSINMASVVMLLFPGHSAHEESTAAQSTARIYECKTCSRQFTSFQALGGHRASHKKPRPVGDIGPGGLQASRPKVHECSVCGLEFAIGQALGGHMRRHRPAEMGGGGGGPKREWLDLNLPAVEEEEEEEEQLRGMVNKIFMVDY